MLVYIKPDMYAAEIREACLHDDVDFLKVFHKEGKLPTTWGRTILHTVGSFFDWITLAAENGSIKIVEWAASLESGIFPYGNFWIKVPESFWTRAYAKGLRPKEEDLDEAAKMNRTDLLEWAAAQNPPLLPSGFSIAEAPQLFDWARAKGVVFTERMVGFLAGLGYFDLVKRLFPIMPDFYGLADAIDHGHPEIARWALTLSPPRPGGYLGTSAVADAAAGGGHFDILEAYAGVGLLPSREGVSKAFQAQRVDVLEWILKKKPELLPTSMDVDDAIFFGSAKSIEWARTKGIFPSHEGYSRAIHARNMDLLEADLSRLSSDEMNAACALGRVEVLAWGKGKGLLPTSEGMNLAIRNYQPQSLAWGKEQLPPILPTIPGDGMGQPRIELH